MLTLLATMAIVSDVSAKAAIAESWNQTLVVGHRGAAAYKPENTVPAFQEAIACQAVAAECDVHISKDGVPIIMHDATLDRTTTLKGRIDATDAAVMKAAGIPTLEDYLDVTQGHLISVIELKEGQDVVAKTVTAVQRRHMVGETIIFSFNDELLAKTKALEPALYTVWLQTMPKNLSAHFTRVDEIKADAIGVDFRGATPEIIKAAHERKMPVFVWTVPPGPEVDRLKGLGVNFIITNHPRDVREQLAKG